MGDRANVLVKDEYDPGVYLYTHWAGSELPTTLQTALSKKWRWNDMPYLARIILREMIRGNENQESGYGISSKMGDGEDRVLLVDCNTQTVSFNNHSWSFEEYINLSEKEIGGLWYLK